MAFVDYGSTDAHLLNALLRGPNLGAGEDERRKTGVILLHGSEGSAMSGINVWLAPYLAERGFSVLSPNKRNSGRLYYTSLFEWYEDDIRRAIDYMQGNVALDKVVLIGHSLGASEAVYYQGKTHDRRVVAFALLGVHLWPGKVLNRKLLHLASRHGAHERFFIDAGDGAPVSAAHYTSYWAPGSNNDSRKWIGSVDVPILNLAHGVPLNSLCNKEASRDLSNLAVSSPSVKDALIPKAPHWFAGHFDEASRIVFLWLKGIES